MRHVLWKDPVLLELRGVAAAADAESWTMEQSWQRPILMQA